MFFSISGILIYINFLASVTLLQTFTVAVCNDLEDFPLDDGGRNDGDGATDDDDFPNSTTTTVEGEMSMANLDMDEDPPDASE